MDRMRMAQRAGCLILLAVLVMSGCKGGNIFGFRDASTDNVGDLIRTGKEQLRDGKFVEAQATFARAITLDNLNSEARFLHAEATLLIMDQQVSVVSLLKAITDEANTVGNSLPLYSPAGGGAPTSEERAEKDLIYTTNITIVNDLDPIAQGLTHGPFDTASVALDLAVAETIRGILRLRDTNNDLRITAQDFFFSVNRISDSNFGMGDLNDAVATAEDVSNFNALIKDLASGDDAIVRRVLDNLERAGLLDTGIDVEEIEKTIDELGDSVLRYLIYNPNNPDPLAEGDNDGDGQTNEEALNGIDDDGDGLIDEDAQFTPGS